MNVFFRKLSLHIPTKCQNVHLLFEDDTHTQTKSSNIQRAQTTKCIRVLCTNKKPTKNFNTQILTSNLASGDTFPLLDLSSQSLTTGILTQTRKKLTQRTHNSYHLIRDDRRRPGDLRSQKTPTQLDSLALSSAAAQRHHAPNGKATRVVLSRQQWPSPI